VQAARCAAVPMAKLEVEKVASTTARTVPEVSLQIRFMTLLLRVNHAATVAQP
jgi:hypothetical protein